MAPSLVERLAELLGLPIEVIQAYGKPQKDVLYPAAWNITGTASEVEPPVRYATSKAVPEAEEVASPKTDENELYAKLRDASDAEKPELEGKLFSALIKHAEAVMWRKIPEADKRLARDIASAVMEHLAEFKGESKFSTWTHSIILNHCYQYLREKDKNRDRYYASENPEDDINLQDTRTEAAFAKVVQAVDLELIDRLAKELPPEEYCVWECWRDGMTMKAIAEKLGISEDKVENSLRRKVKPYLKEKILARN
jgi:RNA polymerase sigma-70 factor (ECF subfamily)